MMENNKPLTPEELAHAYGANLIGYHKKVDKNITGKSPRYIQAINDFMVGYRIAAQQTATLREELEEQKRLTQKAKDGQLVANNACERKGDELKEANEELQKWINRHEIMANLAKEAREELTRQHKIWGDVGKDLMTELEAVKKERGEIEKSVIYWGDLYHACKAQRNEAEELLNDWMIYAVPDTSERGQEIEEATQHYLSRLSSGETKPPEIPDGSSAKPWIKGMPDYDGEYLCHIVIKNECGAFTKKQRVIECKMNKWVVLKNERVTHYKILDSGPESSVILLDSDPPESLTDKP